ncbi:hypothetical protein L873DRAFT_1831644 [Choiromyces venosus 120613-1]|uniref:Uncharacterized protein n=1 Tax=Choiromyces venosus 120613-1 TaxID=1336337 RepID=A0A3N4J2K9_9PEZI|nr:hypothetical protein L873DRAFT_1831644 [Choiromyces venosus 120613-1]
MDKNLNDAPVLSTTPITTATTTVVGPHPLRTNSPAVEKKLEPVPTGKSKMAAKPTAAKPKFSSINGPQIYYDGEAQQALYDCWTTINSKRGLLRKEMMTIKRKRVMTLPTHIYGYDDDSEEEGSDKESDQGPKETEEERLKREEEEREKAEEERLKAEREKKAAEVLEYIDSCLDKASKGCENAAYLWLKGDICTGHITFINSRMQEAVDRINLEMERAKPVEPPVPAPVVEDEGIGAEMDIDVDDTPSTNALPPRKMGTAMRDSRAVGVS